MSVGERNGFPRSSDGHGWEELSGVVDSSGEGVGVVELGVDGGGSLTHRLVSELVVVASNHASVDGRFGSQQLLWLQRRKRKKKRA